MITSVLVTTKAPLATRGCNTGKRSWLRLDRYRPVDNHAFNWIEFIPPGGFFHGPLCVSITGIPAHLDARFAEIDVLGMILVFESRSQQRYDMHVGYAAVAGQIAHPRRVTDVLRHVLYELGDDVTQAVDLLLAGNMVCNAA